MTDMSEASVPTITFSELEQIPAAERPVIDVRPADQFAKGSFPGAVNIEADQLEAFLSSSDTNQEETAAFLSSLSKEKPVYVICHTGERSEKDAVLLAGAGFAAALLCVFLFTVHRQRTDPARRVRK